jgi:hypothetical protein
MRMIERALIGRVAGSGHVPEVMYARMWLGCRSRFVQARW